MKLSTGQKVGAGSGAAAILVAALGWQQIGEVFVLREPYTYDMILVQAQIIDVQIIQANAELNAIVRRIDLKQASASDFAQRDILIARIADLQRARSEMQKVK